MTKKALLLTLITVLVITALSACNSDDKYADDIIGKWECKYGNETVTLVFNKDLTGTARLSPSAELKNVLIKYTLKGEKLTITSYPTDNKGIAIGKADYSIRYYNGNLLIKPYGSSAKPSTFYKIAE